MDAISAFDWGILCMTLALTWGIPTPSDPSPGLKDPPPGPGPDIEDPLNPGHGTEDMQPCRPWTAENLVKAQTLDWGIL